VFGWRLAYGEGVAIKVVHRRKQMSLIKKLCDFFGR
jgi:hypothetical protein